MDKITGARARKPVSAYILEMGILDPALKNDEHTPFHDLRHSFASRLVANGNDLNTVKELMGHSKLTTTRRYLHSSAELKRDAVNSLSEQRHNFGMQCQNSGKKFPDEVEDNAVTYSYLAS
ncbi:MAG: tyrosine-type recombinase/integrase [Candidatus Aminicenantes bacterium]|jgi:site-specific recombinase XerD